jgi:hypothetical protein
MRRVTLDGKFVQHELNLVSMGTDKSHPSSKLILATLFQVSSESGFQIHTPRILGDARR